MCLLKCPTNLFTENPKHINIQDISLLLHLRREKYILSLSIYFQDTFRIIIIWWREVYESLINTLYWTSLFTKLGHNSGFSEYLINCCLGTTNKISIFLLLNLTQWLYLNNLYTVWTIIINLAGSFKLSKYFLSSLHIVIKKKNFFFLNGKTKYW